MLTGLGKLLRKLRIDRGEVLKDMADKLGVTPSYLSAVETGKRNVPKEWIKIIGKEYDLSTAQREELEQLAYEAKRQIKIDLQVLEYNEKNLVLSFARKFKSLNEDDKKQILNILSKYSI